MMNEELLGIEGAAAALYFKNFVGNSDSTQDICHIGITPPDIKQFIESMMRCNNINLNFEGQNISLNFSLSGFTASFKKLLMLSQELE